AFDLPSTQSSPLIYKDIYKDTHRKNFKLITMGVFVFQL
ncbi:MAG: hypothetical protein ACI9YE_002345, partial [Psychroserpens sp.]